MRKILSSNSEASINLESLMEDEDLNKTFKRADLEELIDPVISDFYMTLKESVEKFGKYKFFSYHKRQQSELKSIKEWLELQLISFLPSYACDIKSWCYRLMKLDREISAVYRHREPMIVLYSFDINLLRHILFTLL